MGGGAIPPSSTPLDPPMVVSADIAYGGEKEDTYVHIALYIAMVTSFK